MHDLAKWGELRKVTRTQSRNLGCISTNGEAMNHKRRVMYSEDFEPECYGSGDRTAGLRSGRRSLGSRRLRGVEGT